MGPLLRPQDLGTPPPPSPDFQPFVEKANRPGKISSQQADKQEEYLRLLYHSFKLALCLSWPTSEEENKPKQITI